MIQYALVCDRQHGFDAWFRNAAAYDEQAGEGAVTCPVCGSGKVGKALMAPTVARSGSGKRALSAGHPEQAKLRQALRVLRDKVVSEADYVGDRFAEEARRIHFEEAEARGIYGEATPDEVSGLLEDGVEFLPLPDLPDEAN